MTEARRSEGTTFVPALISILTPAQDHEIRVFPGTFGRADIQRISVDDTKKQTVLDRVETDAVGFMAAADWIQNASPDSCGLSGEHLYRITRKLLEVRDVIFGDEITSPAKPLG